MKFIDIHSHIINQIDDGAQSLEKSLEILEEMEKIGYEKIVLTPHLRQGIFPNKNEDVKTGFEKFKKETGKENVFIGGEYHFDYYFLNKLKEKDLITLNNSDYVLIELNNTEEPTDLKNIVFQTQLNSYTPIIAHPERYVYFQSNIKKVIELKEMGALFQGSLTSFSEYQSKKTQNTSYEFLKKDIYDYLSTDIHRIQFFKEYFNDIIKQITKKTKSDKVEALFYYNALNTIFKRG